MAHAARVVVLPDNHYADLIPKSAEIVTGMRERRPKSSSGARPRLSPREPPGAPERRGRELWDGAHTPAGTAWPASASTSRSRWSSLRSWPTRTRTPCSTTWPRSPRLVATTSDNPRALLAEQLAARAEPHFPQVEIEPDPHRALARARQSSTGLILVTGSLYLLANLAKAEEQDVR